MANGLVGIIGDGSIAEIGAMAARMPYRGRARLWSPAPRVYLGELLSNPEPAPPQGGGMLAVDCNGWLYDNPTTELTHPEIRRQDEQLQLESNLLRDGNDAVARLQGFFALAFWHPDRQTLTLACDRQGYKGLYFAMLGQQRLAFASDYKALLALADCPASVDRQVLQTYLVSRSFSSAKSLLEAAHPVGRAGILTVGLDLARRHETYWNPVRRAHKFTHFPDAVRALCGTLENVLRRQLVGQTRVGVSLSGGLDSAALVAITRHVRPDIEIATYTIGHSDKDIDIIRAQRTAAHFRTTHREIFYDIRQIPKDLHRFVWLTEDLTGREEGLLQQAVTAEVSAHDRLLLAGHGADAALAGMPRHRLLWLRDHMPAPLRGGLDELLAYTQARIPPRSWLGQRLVRLKFHSKLSRMPQVVGVSQSRIATQYPSLEEYRCTNLTTLEGLRFHEPIDADRGVTLLTPFLDHAILEFALDCPTNFLIGAFTQKRVLRAALHELSPAVARLPKTIQRFKHDTHLLELLHDFAQSLRLDQALAARGILDVSNLARMRAGNRKDAGHADHLHVLWTLICTELWLRQFIDARGSHAEQ